MLSHLLFNSFYRVFTYSLIFLLVIHPCLLVAASSTAISTTTPASGTITPAQPPTNSQGGTPNSNTPTVTPAQPPKESDRKGGAGAAQAAAIAGAAMAGLSCIMMLNEARSMPPGSEKNATMAMAMQQCSQAAQSAANAGKNEDAKKALTMNDIPQQGQLTAPTTAQSTDPFADSTVSPSPLPSSTPLLDVDDLTQPTVATPTQVPPPASLNGQPAASTAGNEVLISALKSIENAKVDFNENAKEGDPSLNAGLVGSAMGGFSGRGIASDDLKKTGADAADGNQKKKGGSLDEGGAGGSEGSGTGAKEEGGNSAFDQMLAQLMGGGAQPDQANGMGGADVVALRKDKAGGKTPNIFEYASYRYQTAANEGRLKTRKVAKIGPAMPVGAASVATVSSP